MEIKADLDYCFTVPIQPDKVADAEAFWHEAGTKKAGVMDVFLRDAGQTRVMAFLQTIPGAYYLNHYMRGSDDIRATLMKYRSINLPISDFFLRKFAGFAGFDITSPENIPDLELLFDWNKREGRDEPSDKHAVYAAKLLPGSADEVKRLYTEFKDEKLVREIEQSIGSTILRALVFLQHRPEGDYLVKYAESAEPIEKMTDRIMKSNQPIFKRLIDVSMRVTGVDYMKPENMPKLKLLFDWSAKEGVRTGKAAIAHSR